MKKYLPSPYVLLGIIMTTFLIVLCRITGLDWYKTLKAFGIIVAASFGMLLLVMGLTKYEMYRNEDKFGPKNPY